MRFGTRYGVAVGFGLLPVVFSVSYGYRPDGLDAISPWLAPVAPVAMWTTVEMAAWARPRARWLSKAMVPVAVVAAGVWGWWISGVLSFGGATTVERVYLPALIVLAYAGAATVSGRLLARRRTTAGVDGEP